MARLNEPPVSTDALETLRRRFLRQNRDIAKINSAQSLRIRSLESECGRLLSDNLALNSRILELENELKEYKGAQRIADHALEIKTRMEAQLIEWGAMIQGLGVEPAAKRHVSMSPGGTKTSRQRHSADLSPAAKRRPRDSRSAEEAARQEEGRLPPIHENKTYPRRTMRYVGAQHGRAGLSEPANMQDSHAELVAICTDAEDTNDSPDLGPPPTSRYVEEDPIKIDSPSRSTSVLETSPKIRRETLAPPESPPQLKLDPKKRPILPTEAATATSPEPTKPAADAPALPLVKAGSKRKFGDENYEIQAAAKSGVDKENGDSKLLLDDPLATTDLKSRASGNAKGLSSHKNGAKNGRGVGRPRKPLADKTTNDDLVSPKKTIKVATIDNLKKATTESERTVAPLKKKRVVPIKLPIPHLPAPTAVNPPEEPATPSADPGIVFPETPETKSVEANPGDTPPPADISVHGETSRPSRRARPAISYAEPNLRDKMRRPTKELFDAVSGEGKFVRSSSAHPLGVLSSSKLKIDDESSVEGSSKQSGDGEKPIGDRAARRPALLSPLLLKEAPKDQPGDYFPDSIITERRRRPSSRQSQLFEQQADPEGPDGKEKQDETDPYEFRSMSPASAQPKENATRGRVTKGMRRSMAGSAGEAADATIKEFRPSRKRASMAAPRKTSMLECPLDEDSSFEASGDPTKAEPSSSLKDRVSRRRSMML
ncbi:hypothetical protein M406DRAFT_68494 [Cryphonectria parasitica EP155]|uniref:Shugoshin n=1 Tax=Cryphonectria parasitica (strain ATCC 38755 / EP155) TaxID=660469 RepID=A0A9P4Y408_CRYP1|nr:uncharacterized protein M406DRAFT_68494 [Cryphonectria parasitica EP155]KAF3766121.1 hypothetical protein M406DRAFT_68494 [Cryphonectria parasitica EP155]